MSSSPPPLPTPRQLLTSILNAISRIPAPEQQQQQPQTRSQATAKPRVNSSLQQQAGDDEIQQQPTTTTTTNPLRLVDPAHRPLFATLHVLFPSLLLPALDLLDRGLVTRLDDDGTTGRKGKQQQDDGHGADVMRRDTSPPSSPASSPSPSVYLVRSAQKPTRRPFGSGGGGGVGGAGGDPTMTTASATSTGTGAQQRTYVVHTAAWNCTCATFAFSAFPPAAGWSSLPLGRTRSAGAKGLGQSHGEGEGGGMDEDHASIGLRAAAGDEHWKEDSGRGPAEWQFGGLSCDGDLDGDGEAVPPCCKHLLACVLAERWGAALGRYIVRRTVGREEMAGIFADI